MRSLYKETYPAASREELQVKKYEGCLLGIAVGDALGAPVEKLTLSEIRKRYGTDGIMDFDEFRGFKEGSYTDDTQMSIATAVGLIDADRIRREKGSCYTASKIYKRYLEWFDSQDDPEDRRGPGRTCLSALGSGTMGTLEERINDSRGCGGVMRVAPAGLAFSPRKAFEEAARFAAITHGHPSGNLSAGFLAETIACIMDGKMLDEAIASAKTILVEYEGHGETLEKIELALELSESQHTLDYSIRTIGLGFTGEEALAISLYCTLLFFDDWEQGVLSAVNHSGDSDSTGSITGALLGALLGVGSIPSRWVHNVENSVMIQELAREMFQLFAKNNAKR